MKYYIIIFFLFLVSCQHQETKEKYQKFDIKQEKITVDMTFKEVSKILGKPEFINIHKYDSIFVCKYNYGNLDGYRYSIGFSKDSLVIWKGYEN